MGSNDYWGVQESDWADAPVLGEQQLRPQHRRPALRALLQRPAPPHGRPAGKAARATGSSTACSTGSRTRRCSRSPRACGRSRRREVPRNDASATQPVPSERRERLPFTCRRLRRRLRRPRHRRLLRRARPLRSRPRRPPERIAALRRGEVPIYEPGLAELMRGTPSDSGFTTDVAEAIDGADFVYIAVGTPPTYSGDADLSAVWTVIDELPAIDRRCVVVMKSTVPVGTGWRCATPRRARPRRRSATPRTRSSRQGTAVERLSPPRPDRRRRVPRRGRRRRRGVSRGIEAPSSVATSHRLR